jgi:hypothetical protein
MNQNDSNYGQMSDDGNWWWDGTQWVPTNRPLSSDGTTATSNTATNTSETKSKNKVALAVIVGLSVLLASSVAVGIIVSSDEDSSEPSPSRPTSTYTPRPAPAYTPPPVTSQSDEEKMYDYLCTKDSSFCSVPSSLFDDFATAACAALDAGASTRDVIGAMVDNNTTMTPEQIGTLLAASVVFYCPWNA